MKAATADIRQEPAVIEELRKCAWIYVLLLIFEGALRKWVLPSLSEPLLIIRDPLAIWMLYKTWRYNVMDTNMYIVIVYFISILSFFLTLFIGHGSIVVAIYGLRIPALHFPLIFIFARVLTHRDVVQMGKMLLWITIGMTILIGLQFYSSQSAWVNRGIGGDMEGSGFSGAGDYYRVPGTFSFTSGLSTYYGLVAPFIFYFWISENRQGVQKWLLIAASIALLSAVPLSISRGLVAQIAITVIFTLVIVGQKPQVMKGILGALVAGAVLVVLLSNMEFFQTAMEALTTRFTAASNSEGDFVEGTVMNRVFGGIMNAVGETEIPFWGAGLGMGTNAGAKMLTGQRMFLLSEGEWGRVIGEMGVLLGISFILLRLGLVVELALKGWKSAGQANYLPWLLLSFAATAMLLGQWGQPTSLGFGVVGAGLALAALNTPDKETN